MTPCKGKSIIYSKTCFNIDATSLETTQSREVTSGILERAVLRVVLLNITELEREQTSRQPSSLTTLFRTLKTKSQLYVIRKLSMLTDLNDKKVETHC